MKNIPFKAGDIVLCIDGTVRPEFGSLVLPNQVVKAGRRYTVERINHRGALEIAELPHVINDTRLAFRPGRFIHVAPALTEPEYYI